MNLCVLLVITENQKVQMQQLVKQENIVIEACLELHLMIVWLDITVTKLKLLSLTLMEKLALEDIIDQLDLQTHLNAVLELTMENLDLLLPRIV